ncbi:TetR/AcrR family transcriptional regulator [Gordonia hankookensis]|uniref:TetR/AcrR family transcriptional regulator n=1 Tax=Gordonia hankookensis TaxID=589403 RepID=A0ABR7W8R5_9ACTN|nr:TetR/AcrR family transcriptional regulator [Gordonia hankookensis]MBD1318643.1 TetR/AcrR family transcriptional regulator [Gordonia hankookensis]NDZ94166.1 TetR/AcrR family transcriptional regulator [Streptomyces sp. SID11726]NEB25184.1 TetR/AcrR family transcriptional regulator [Streptomyces sp. SID6673]
MAVTRAGDSVAAERIRQAAIASFAEVGYGGTSTRQIAKRLNMSAAAMYPHYRSKEELLYAIALQGHRGVLAALRAVDDESAPDDQRLRAVVREFARWQAEHHQLAKVVQYELHGLTHEHYREITAIRRDTSDVIGAIVSRGVASGEFTVAAADDAVLALSSLCVDVCRWFPSRTHRDPEALGHAYGDLAVRMVR